MSDFRLGDLIQAIDENKEAMNVQLTGSITQEILTTSNITVDPGQTYIIDEFDMEDDPVKSVYYGITASSSNRSAKVLFLSTVEDGTWNGSRSPQMFIESINTSEKPTSDVIFDTRSAGVDDDDRIGFTTKELVPLGRWQRFQIENTGSLSLSLNRGMVKVSRY